jgi:carboxymethylenebutenolidase
MGPNGGDTRSFASQDDVTQAVWALPDAQVQGDLDAVADYALHQPSCNGQVMVAGFCWGGGKAFSYATHNKKLSAAFVFYGVPPSLSEMAGINCPVYGFYAENDNRITSTVKTTTADMKTDGKTYEPVIYAGAGHGFMRAGMYDNPKPANQQAMLDAWKRWVVLLAKIKASAPNPAPVAPPKS